MNKRKQGAAAGWKKAKKGARAREKEYYEAGAKERKGYWRAISRAHLAPARKIESAARAPCWVARARSFSAQQMINKQDKKQDTMLMRRNERQAAARAALVKRRRSGGRAGPPSNYAIPIATRAPEHDPPVDHLFLSPVFFLLPSTTLPPPRIPLGPFASHKKRRSSPIKQELYPPVVAILLHIHQLKVHYFCSLKCRSNLHI